MMRIRFRRHGFHEPPRPNGSMPFRPRARGGDRPVGAGMQNWKMDAIVTRLASSTRRFSARFSVASRVHEISPPLLSATGGSAPVRPRRGWLPLHVSSQNSEANDGQQMMAKLQCGHRLTARSKDSIPRENEKQDVFLWTCCTLCVVIKK